MRWREWPIVYGRVPLRRHVSTSEPPVRNPVFESPDCVPAAEQPHPRGRHVPPPAADLRCPAPRVPRGPASHPGLPLSRAGNGPPPRGAPACRQLPRAGRSARNGGLGHVRGQSRGARRQASPAGQCRLCPRDPPGDCARLPAADGGCDLLTQSRGRLSPPAHAA